MDMCVTKRNKTYRKKLDHEVITPVTRSVKGYTRFVE